MKKFTIENTQIEDYLSWCYCKNYSYTTIKSKKHNLYQAFNQMGIKSLEEINNRLLHKYLLNQKLKGIRASSINSKISILKAMSRYLSEELNLTIPIKQANFPKLNEDPARRKYFSREEIDQVVDLACIYDKLLIRLLFETAMRLSEVTTLKVDQVRGREIVVIGKGKKRGVLCISEELANDLDQYVKSKNITGYIFTGLKNGPKKHIGTDAVRIRIKKAFKRAGIYDAYPHAIRHSRATDLKRNGAPNDVIKRFLRHSSIATTEIYMHYFEGPMIEHFDRYTV